MVSEPVSVSAEVPASWAEEPPSGSVLLPPVEPEPEPLVLPSVGLSVGPSVGSVGLPVGWVGSSLGGVEVGGCEDGGSELGGSLVGVFGAVGRPLSVGAGESVPSPGRGRRRWW